MWALPDIYRLNRLAAANAANLRREAKAKRKPQCQIDGCLRPASHSDLWFDIFSDDPKGVIHSCSEHQPEAQTGFFHCDGCENLVIDHYTWERYEVHLNGQSLCLKCAAEEYFSDPDNWVEPREVWQVVLDPDDSRFFSAGILNLARCRHVLGVSQPLPKGIRFHANAEFDSDTGHQISGRKIIEIIHELDQPCCLVLDAAYQFACSVGIYVRAALKRRKGHIRFGERFPIDVACADVNARACPVGS